MGLFWFGLCACFFFVWFCSVWFGFLTSLGVEYPPPLAFSHCFVSVMGMIGNNSFVSFRGSLSENFVLGLCTMYCIVCTAVYFVLCTAYCVLRAVYSVYYVLCAAHCVLRTVYCVLCTVRCEQGSEWRMPSVVRCLVLCTAYCVLRTV